MSWNRLTKPYRQWTLEAEEDTISYPHEPFVVRMWSSNASLTDGTWTENITEPTDIASNILPAGGLRIIFAPLDLPRKATYATFVRLFKVLRIPDAFTVERVDSVSHSLGTRTDPDQGSCLWFHFLCKHIHVLQQTRGRAGIITTTSIMCHPDADLTERKGWFAMHRRPVPNSDFSYVRSGFFLRTEKGGESTLTCFGAPTHVRDRIEQFLDARAWGDVAVEPYVLLDLVLEGLYKEVDENVWNIADVLGPLEHKLLTGSHVADSGFAAIQNLGKNISYLGEGVESVLLVVDGLIGHMEAALQTISHVAPAVISTSPQQQRSRQSSSSSTIGGRTMTPGLHVEPPNTRETVLLQLVEGLSYRRSVLRSTKLRLGSLRDRISNAINLSFNLLTQRDSRLMIVVAAITVMFLPLTAVASVVGSQVFTTSKSDESGSWTVEKTPLFADLWYITVPLTAIVVVVAWSLGWHRPQLLDLAHALKAMAQTVVRRMYHGLEAWFRRRHPTTRAGHQV